MCPHLLGSHSKTTASIAAAVGPRSRGHLHSSVPLPPWVTGEVTHHTPQVPETKGAPCTILEGLLWDLPSAFSSRWAGSAEEWGSVSVPQPPQGKKANFLRHVPMVRQKPQFIACAFRLNDRARWGSPTVPRAQSTPVFLPQEPHGQRSLVGYSAWGCRESDTTRPLSTAY